MKIKKALLSCLLLAGVLSASAQEPEAKTEYVFNHHWYIQLQGGGQYTLGEVDFDKLISPNVQFAIGYQINPVVGIRLQANAWQSKGGWDYINNTRMSNFEWKYNYVAPGLDFTFNLSNLFCGFNPKRLVDFSVFAGAGANIAWKNDEANDAFAQILGYQYQPGDAPITSYKENLDYLWDGTKVHPFGRFGAAVDFRLSDAVKLGVEANANFTDDHYNSKRAGNPDWYFNALLGLKINLGKTYTTRTVEAPKPVERVVEKVIERVVEKPVPQVVEQPAVVEKKDPFRRDVFFTISSVSIRKAEMVKVKEVAEYLKANPNAKVEVTGYADKGTGNAKINLSLSQRRAQAVTNALIKTYGIAASRITTDYKGDTVQPFAKAIENRVTICIAE